MSPRRGIILLLIAGFAVIAVALAIAVLLDVRNDRRNEITVRVATPLYAELPTSGHPAEEVVGIVAAGAQPRVLRIRYGKDFMAIQVELANGQRGWIVLDGRNIAFTRTQ